MQYYQGQAGIAPLWMWAYAWWFTSAVLFFFAFKKKDAFAFALGTGIKVAWAAAYFLGWLFHDQTRGWISATTWLAIAVWLRIVAGWPEGGRRAESSS